MSDRRPSRRAYLAGAALLAVPGLGACVDPAGGPTPPTADETPPATPTAGPPTTAEPPVADFSFNYDSDGTLDVTFSGGDTVLASELYVRGEGFADVEGVDMIEPGPWAGDASVELGGEPAVVAGDSVILGVRPGYTVRLVWQAADGERSRELAVDRGPEA